MIAAKSFRYEVAADGVATITLDRPDTLNSLTFEVYAELRDCFRALENERDVKSVVITGAGRGFCSGGSVHEIIGPLFEMTPAERMSFTRMTGALIGAIRQLHKPIVAAINGVAAGAGAVIALACDFRVMSEKAKIAFLFVKVGLAGADMGAAWLLPQIVGLGRATELLMLGEPLVAADAHKIGLTNSVVAPDAVLPTARALAAKLAAGPLFALGMTKEMLSREPSLSLEEALEAEAQAQQICMATRDFREAYEAFVAKREPKFEALIVPTGFLEERHIALRHRAQAWVDAADLESDHDARGVVDRLARHELLKACVPSAFGGLRERVELRDLCVLRAVLGYRSSFADTMFAMQGLGSYPVTLAGSDEQRRALLPRVVDGSAVCAFAITEPDAGSDVSAITTRAVRDGDAYVIDGTKCFISNAGVADSYVLFARTSDDRHRGLSAFLLDGSANGLTIVPTELIAPHPIGTLTLAGVRLPVSARLGDEGSGFSLAMATLDFFRTSVGAAALGMAARALDEARARVLARRQFGRPLADFQATQMAIAEMAVDVAAARLLVFSAAHRIDTSEGPGTVDAAMAKLYATEAAQRVIDRAVQLFGGQGVVAGCIVERLYREVRALRIYEGTSEIQKLVIGKALLRA